VLGYFITTGLQVNAQEIGVRWGKTVGNDVALDLLLTNAKGTRVHSDISFGTGVGLDILWDFMYKPLPIGSENFHLYVGAGPSMLIHDPFLLGISGEVGLEYHFTGAPISLGIDWRPTFYLTPDTDFDGDGFGFNARYVFGKK
jgi:hypothetical protein